MLRPAGRSIQRLKFYGYRGLDRSRGECGATRPPCCSRFWLAGVSYRELPPVGAECFGALAAEVAVAGGRTGIPELRNIMLRICRRGSARFYVS